MYVPDELSRPRLAQILNDLEARLYGLIRICEAATPISAPATSRKRGNQPGAVQVEPVQVEPVQVESESEAQE